MLTLISSNYPCLEHIFMVPEVFEPLKFYCSYILMHVLLFVPGQKNDLDEMFKRLDTLMTEYKAKLETDRGKNTNF